MLINVVANVYKIVVILCVMFVTMRVLITIISYKKLYE